MRLADGVSIMTDLIPSIVRVQGDRSTGAGFVVSADGLIATCAHVVQHESVQAVDIVPPEQVTIVFLLTGESRTAHVEQDKWRPTYAGDLAFLRLDGPLPRGVRPLPLGTSTDTSGHSFKSYGFPRTRGSEGMEGYGTIGGHVPDAAGHLLLQLAN